MKHQFKQDKISQFSNEAKHVGIDSHVKFHEWYPAKLAWRLREELEIQIPYIPHTLWAGFGRIKHTNNP